MSETPRNQLSYLTEGQNLAEVFINENSIILDVFTNCRLTDRDQVIEPASPANGDVYLVADPPLGTDSFDGHGSEFAAWYNDQWYFFEVPLGTIAYVEDEDIFIGKKSSGWVTITTS